MQYYAATYGICGIVWYVEFITDTDGLVGDYFRPATTLCNLATYPRTFDCVWNTFQNCYRYIIQIAKNYRNTIYQFYMWDNKLNNNWPYYVFRNDCGLIGVEWAALPKLKGTVLGWIPWFTYYERWISYIHVSLFPLKHMLYGYYIFLEL